MAVRAERRVGAARTRLALVVRANGPAGVPLALALHADGSTSSTRADDPRGRTMKLVSRIDGIGCLRGPASRRGPRAYGLGRSCSRTSRLGPHRRWPRPSVRMDRLACHTRRCPSRPCGRASRPGLRAIHPGHLRRRAAGPAQPARRWSWLSDRTDQQVRPARRWYWPSDGRTSRPDARISGHGRPRRFTTWPGPRAVCRRRLGGRTSRSSPRADGRGHPRMGPGGPARASMTLAFRADGLEGSARASLPWPSAQTEQQARRAHR